jgi:hypothetical protein
MCKCYNCNICCDNKNKKTITFFLQLKHVCINQRWLKKKKMKPVYIKVFTVSKTNQELDNDRGVCHC